jgi:sterol desaturase/sphingolipid hydroxylase (fatty acid hydroxylase superfamily)
MAFIWKTVLATLPGIASYFGVVVVFVLAERFFPAERHQPFRGLLFNARYTLLYFLVTPFVILLPTALANRIASASGGSLWLVNLDQWAGQIQAFTWPLRTLVFPFIPMLVFDLFYYWHHRLQHTIPFLWEQHKLHHTEQNLCCLTNLRHHWLEDGIRVFTITIPMTALVTITPVQGGIIAAAIAQWAIFIHANLRLPMGVATSVLAGPQVHRIHHSRDPRHSGKNYAAFFPVWDILFGTYYRPARGEWPATGLESGENVGDLWNASLLPFRGWMKMLGRQAGEPDTTPPMTAKHHAGMGKGN